MCVVPVSKAIAGDVPEVLFGILKHSGHVRVVFLSSVEKAGNGGCRDGWPTSTPFGTVLHTAVGHRARVNVADGFIDNFSRHRNASIAAASQPLHLSDGGGTFVEVVAVLRADIPPTAVCSLRPARKLDRLHQHPNQFLAATFVFLLAEHLREKEHRKTVTVGVAVVGFRITDKAVGPGTADQIINCLTDRLSVTPLRCRATLHEHGRARKGCHGCRVTTLVCRPTPSAGLLAHQPVKPLRNDSFDLLIAGGGLHQSLVRLRKHERQKEKCPCLARNT